jgi:GntP family gluconate:H+ symporter
MAFMATVLATSLYSVHCLIPPHPGALAAADIAGANVGTMIIAGILFAIPGVLSAWFWSKFILRGTKLMPASGELSPVNNEHNPPVLLSFLPIIIPLLLITLLSVVRMFDRDGTTLLFRILRFPGEPVFALAIGVLLSLFLFKKKSIESINSVFGEAIEKAGPILIVTAAGGMFGMVIRETGVGESAGGFLASTGAGLLVPFLIAVFMKSAQGSSTVAIITTASFVVPVLETLGLGSEWGKILALLSMGAGSMIVSHANDSYFWVISSFSGIEMKTMLRVYTTSTAVMGITVFLFVWLSSLILL